MAEVRYVPAAAAEGWRAAVSAQAIAVLSPAVTPQTAEAVWRRLDGGGIGALVEALTGAFGTSLTAIPPFALIVAEDDGVRIAVRGPLEVVVEAEGGAVEVSGRGVATWAERLVGRSQRVTVALEGDVDETQALPIVSGVVPAGGIVLTTVAARAAAAVPAPVPVVVDGESDAAADASITPEEPASEATVGATVAHDTTVAPDTTVGATTTTGEPSGSDTWIPAHTQTPPSGPVTDVPGSATPVSGTPLVADDSTIATPGRGQAPWAATVVRDAVPADPRPRGGDHDGATISVAEARALRGEKARFEPVADVPPRRPTQGRVRLSSGQVVELERPVVIGRRPRSTRASGAELPTLVAVESPEGDISRSHVEIRAEGEHVLVTDLATTNGTVLHRGGQDPVRLHPGEPTMVVSGDVLDLGDGVTVTFEDLP